jgi:hypothetical protein
MLSSMARPRAKWRTLKFPQLPKLNKYRILALLIGFVVWFSLGFLLKYQFDKYLALIIGFFMAYGPLLCWIGTLRLAYKLFDRGQIGWLLSFMVASGPLAYVIGALESNFIKKLLLRAGFSFVGQIPLSVSVCLITWLLMPYLWQKGELFPPSESA